MIIFSSRCPRVKNAPFRLKLLHIVEHASHGLSAIAELLVSVGDGTAYITTLLQPIVDGSTQQHAGIQRHGLGDIQEDGRDTETSE